MKTDVQIAMETPLKSISEIAELVGLEESELELYGRTKAKIDLGVLERLKDKPDGKLVLVTAISPTPAGEGKTTVNIGLSMGLNRIGFKAISALREPSLGPSFGVKGGAAGGGYAQVLPMQDINMHFTGDMHAITTANNLVAAMLDNHMQQGNSLDIDPRRIVWKRCVDLNDRALRNVVVGLGGPLNGVPREDGFDITVATEMMAVLCLSKDLEDLKDRVSKMIVAYNRKREPIYVKDLKAQGAVALIMKDAIKPNLVQTIEHTPAILHGGPFANIAHGCNSIIATKLALKLADFIVTEAGFGADLGAEKFLDIKCPYGGFKPDACVIVATVRALKHHGGVLKADLNTENIPALEKGFANLKRHVENMLSYGLPVLVAINRFPSDTEVELKVLQDLCEGLGVKAVPSDVFAKGGSGAEDLARTLVDLLETVPTDYKPLYERDLALKSKIEKVAEKVYRAQSVTYSKKALNALENAEKMGFGHFPVCIAKTQYSFSDDPTLLGAPEGFEIHVSDVRISAGAGFIVCLTGDIMTMPGLPKVPAAEAIDVLEDGEIVGLF